MNQSNSRHAMWHRSCALVLGLWSASAAFAQSFPVDSNAPDHALEIRTAIRAASIWLSNVNNVNDPNAVATIEFDQDETYFVDSNFLDVNGVDTGAAFLISGLDVAGRMRFVGNGATIVNRVELSTTLRILDSHRIDVFDLKFDVWPLPYMVGDVTAVNGNCNGFILVQLTDGKSPLDFPPDQSGDPENPGHWGGLLDLDPNHLGRSEPGTKSIYRASDITLYNASQNVYRMRINTPTTDFCEDFQVGDRFTYQHRMGGVTIQLRESTDIEVRDCVCVASSSMFVNTDDTHDLRVIDCRVEIEPGRKRSINGDGVHVKRGSVILIEGCYFEGLMDDAINLTEVNEFEVRNNTFENKRRFAIVLDGDDQLSHDDICVDGDFGPLNSYLGVIENNTVMHCGASFIAHQGGDYSSVTIAGNTVLSNNTEDAAWLNFRVQILTSGPNPLALSVDEGSNGFFDDGDIAVLESDVQSADRIWHINGYRCGGHFIYHRASQDANSTQYLGGAPGPVNPSDPTVALSGRLSVGAPELEADEFWVVESVSSSSDVVRFRHTATGNYLTATTLAVGSPVQLMPLDPSDRGQLWEFRYLED